MAKKRRDNHEWQRTNATFGIPSEGVDRDAGEAGVIRGVAICTEGPALGHGVELDSDFIEDVVKHGKQKQTGAKSRFGHPAMSGTALGTFLGRAKNFRLDDSGEKAIARADLHVDPSADSSPDGKLGTYVIDLADSDPEAFGTSIVFSPGEDYKRDASGNKVTRPDADASKSTRDEQREKWDTTPGPLYASLEELHAADVVDDPAANPSGIFANGSIGDNKTFGSETTIAGQVSAFLDAHPQIFEAVAADPSVIDGFMDRYKAYTKRKGNFDMANETPDKETPPTEETPAEETTPTEETPTEDAPTGETPAEDAPAEETPAETVEQSAVDTTRVIMGDGEVFWSVEASRGHCARFVKAFGAENGAKWFCEGVEYSAAQELHAKAQGDELAKVRQQLKVAKAGLGEETPFEFDDNSETQTDQATADKAELARLVESFGGDEKRAQRAFDDRRKPKPEKK
jgi:hypothetical protein